MKWAAVACALFVSAPVVAQVNYEPTPRPIVTAENDPWFMRGDPIVFFGVFYYQTGPVVFFNGDTMVRTGQYNGVPFYVNKTIEPYSQLLVPIGRGRMQPYERLRDGDLAGTTGSTVPSFPGRLEGEVVPFPLDAIIGYTPGFGAVPTVGSFDAVPTVGSYVPEIVDEESIAPIPPSRRVRGKPFSYNSISIQYLGMKWVMAGPSGPLRDGLIQVGEHKDFPVYAEPGRERTRVYLQFAPGRFAPFKPQH
jgi:hypothetical protein